MVMSYPRNRAAVAVTGGIVAALAIIGVTLDAADERSKRMRTVKLVLPVDANIAEGRISIMTPMGAALYGLRAGDAIDWPDNDGNARRITIKRVSQPEKPLTN